MALSNAERQRRWRDRLKAKAAGAVMPKTHDNSHDATRRRIMGAIAALAGQGPAQGVSSLFDEHPAGTDQALLIDERVADAAEWLAEFARLRVERAKEQ